VTGSVPRSPSSRPVFDAQREGRTESRPGHRINATERHSRHDHRYVAVVGTTDHTDDHVRLAQPARTRLADVQTATVFSLALMGSANRVTSVTPHMPIRLAPLILPAFARGTRRRIACGCCGSTRPRSDTITVTSRDRAVCEFERTTRCSMRWRRPVYVARTRRPPGGSTSTAAGASRTSTAVTAQVPARRQGGSLLRREPPADERHPGRYLLTAAAGDCPETAI